MYKTIDRHLRTGMHVAVNQHQHLVITDPETGKFFVLTGVTKSEADHLHKRKIQKYGTPIRTRFIH